MLDIKNKILQDGREKLHLVIDFDRTLTVSKDGINQASTTFSLFREQGILGEDYDAKSKKLFAHYHPIEISMEISEEEKFKHMETWWAAHLDLQVASGLSRQLMRHAVASGNMKPRDFAKEIFQACFKKNIPIIILSAGLGDVIKEFLEQEQMTFPNVKIISNWYTFDDNGKVTGYKRPFIHSLNKDEDHVPQEVKTLVKERENVILVGDSLADLKMMPENFNGNVFKVGFTNGNTSLEESFVKNFDLVLKENSSGMEDILGIIKEV